MNIFDLLLSWHGRIGRLTHVVTIICLSIVQSLSFGVLGLALPAEPSTISLASFGALAVILWLAFSWPFWMVSIKRAHDLGKSGWWVFGWSMAILPMIILLGIGSTLSDSGSRAVFFVAGGAICLAMFWNLFIRMFFFAGTPGTNQFGPPPNLAQQMFNGDASTALPPARAPAAHPFDRVAATAQPTAPAARPASAAPVRKPTIVANPASAPKSGGFGKRGLKPV